MEFMGLSPAELYSLSEAIKSEKSAVRENEKWNGKTWAGVKNNDAGHKRKGETAHACQLDFLQ